ncbi:hypothetical protein GCM10010331_16750 [Streptomyces xanthochromogenes]|nr:hypothetical protein GCM10010331_16750 [Streptomyces xanthochromogenes]
MPRTLANRGAAVIDVVDRGGLGLRCAATSPVDMGSWPFGTFYDCLDWESHFSPGA